MGIPDTVWRILRPSITDLAPTDVWSLFALVALLYAGVLFICYLRLGLAAVPTSAKGAVLAVALFLGVVLMGVISQDRFRSLLVSELVLCGAAFGLAFVGLGGQTAGRDFAAGGARSLAEVLPYGVSLLYLFAHRSLAVTVLFLAVITYQCRQSVRDAVAAFSSGSGATSLRLLYPVLAFLALSGVLLTPACISGYPAVEILCLAAAFLAGLWEHDRRFGGSRALRKASLRLPAYVLLVIMAVLAVTVYARDLGRLPAQVLLLASGRLGLAR